MANQDRDFLKEKGLPLQAIYDPIVKSGPPSCLLKVAVVMANQPTPPGPMVNKPLIRPHFPGWGGMLGGVG